MNRLIIFFFLTSLWIKHGVGHPDVEEFCFSVMKQAQAFCSREDSTTCQGRPGKRGVMGPVGPKGEKGDMGEGERLSSQIRRLEAHMEEIKKILPVDTKIDYCAMGMKDGTIPDSAITASSEYDQNHRPSLGRLDNQKRGGSHGMWSSKLKRAADVTEIIITELEEIPICSLQPDRVGEWIQVDLGLKKSLSGVVTQGRPQDLSHWVTSFKVACGNRTDAFKNIQEDGQEKVFTGNRDNGSKVVNIFPYPVSCKYIRILPQTWHGYINLRLELLRGDCNQYF